MSANTLPRRSLAAPVVAPGALLHWTGRPHAAGELESLRVLEVLSGERRYSPADFSDARLHLVAAIGESCREARTVPTPERIVCVMRRMGYDTRGAHNWIAGLLFDEPEGA